MCISIFQVSLENHSGPPEKHRNNIAKTISEPANGVPRLPVPPSGGADKREARVTMSQLSPSQLHNVPLNDTSAASAQPRHPPATTQPVLRQGFCKLLLHCYFIYEFEQKIYQQSTHIKLVTPVLITSLSIVISKDACEIGICN